MRHSSLGDLRPENTGEGFLQACPSMPEHWIELLLEVADDPVPFKVRVGVREFAGFTGDIKLSFEFCLNWVMAGEIQGSVKSAVLDNI